MENPDNHKCYPFTCPVCTHAMDACTSLLMDMGYNCGAGTCSQCKTYLHLELNEDQDDMIATDYHEWYESYKEGRWFQTHPYKTHE